MGQIRIRQFEVVQVPFPFSNQQSKKVRPALVISHDKFNNKFSDVVICAVSSNPDRNECGFTIHNDDFSEGGIPVTSVARMNVLTTIDKSLIIKSFGVLKPEFKKSVELCLAMLVVGH